MKKHLLLTMAGLCMLAQTWAQDVTPGTILDQFNKVMVALNKKYVEYQSVLAHSDNPRKAERKRQELINQVTTARQSLAEIPYYKSDRSLHNSTAAYLKLLDYNLNEDFSKMVNMKDIAEQSYDKMEAYLLFREKVSEKMKAGGDSLSNSLKRFAANHNIILQESTSELDNQMDKISEVTSYYDRMFLLFFKCDLMNEDMVEALGKKDVKGLEQARSAMKQFAEEGLAVLDTTKSYHGDASLTNSLRRAMQFFKMQAEKAAEYSSFYTKQEAFDRLKQQFEGDRDAQRDKAQVDKYNAAIKDVNNAINAYNATNEQLNRTRKEAYSQWNEAVKVFFDRHIPVAR